VSPGSWRRKEYHCGPPMDRCDKKSPAEASVSAVALLSGPTMSCPGRVSV
jgi:hypothetical protein